MMGKSGNSTVLALAAMLGKHVETKVVMDALQLICDAYSFDGGMVYEASQDNHFSLMEHVTNRTTKLCPRFAADMLSPEYRERLAEDLITYVEGKGSHREEEQLLLQTLQAASMVMVTNVDEAKRIYGFVAFFFNEKQKGLTTKQMEEAAVFLPMLSRYTGIRMYQNSLSFAQKSLESILDNTGIDIYVNDFDNHDILYVNRSMAAPYGGISQFVGRKCFEVLFPGQGGPCEFCPQNRLTDDEGNPTKVYTWDYQRAFDGSWFRVFSAAFRWVDGRLAHVVSSADITDNKKNEKLIEYMANYDSLTGLPNRRRFVLDCEKRIDSAKTEERGYILFFDIDGFKAINDSFGHESGDEFLISLGSFFSNIPLLQDGIYRNGGDEFVAIIGGNITKANIRNLSSFIHRRFEQPWQLKKGNASCNISIGVACYPEDGDNAEILLSKADQAMYRVKKNGGGNVVFYGD